MAAGQAAGEALEALAKQVRDLSAADKLRLAAGLLDVSPPRLTIASRIVDDVATELGAMQLLKRGEKGKTWL